jgi:hypothetical protein
VVTEKRDFNAAYRPFPPSPTGSDVRVIRGVLKGDLYCQQRQSRRSDVQNGDICFFVVTPFSTPPTIASELHRRQPGERELQTLCESVHVFVIGCMYSGDDDLHVDFIRVEKKRFECVANVSFGGLGSVFERGEYRVCFVAEFTLAKDHRGGWCI